MSVTAAIAANEQAIARDAATGRDTHANPVGYALASLAAPVERRVAVAVL